MIKIQLRLDNERYLHRRDISSATPSSQVNALKEMQYRQRDNIAGDIHCIYSIRYESQQYYMRNYGSRADIHSVSSRHALLIPGRRHRAYSGQCRLADVNESSEASKAMVIY